MSKEPNKTYNIKIASLSFARRLRRNQTDQEKILWRKLRNHHFSNFKFRRQEIIGPYIADFICHEKKLIIEADGSHHDIDQDRERDYYLHAQGYRVLRFANFDIQRDLPMVLDNIWIALHDENFAPNVIPPSPPAAPDPLPTGRGVTIA